MKHKSPVAKKRGEKTLELGIGKKNQKGKLPKVVWYFLDLEKEGVLYVGVSRSSYLLIGKEGA